MLNRQIMNAAYKNVLITEQVAVNQELVLDPYDAPSVQYKTMNKVQILNFMNSIDWMNDGWTFHHPKMSVVFEREFETYKDKATNKLYYVYKDFDKIIDKLGGKSFVVRLSIAVNMGNKQFNTTIYINQKLSDILDKLSVVDEL